MSIKIGEARISENGTIYADNAGDQTGKEVCLTTFYNLNDKPWKYVFRPKKQEIQERLWNAMLQACINDHIGYSQKVTGEIESTRYGLYSQMVKTGCILAIDKYVNCDCSSLVACCCIISGIDVSRYMSTSSEVNLLTATGEFDCIPYKDGMILYQGDILYRNGHTGIIVESDCVRTWIKYVAKAKDYVKVYKDIDGIVLLNEWPLLGPGNLVDVIEPADLAKIRIAGLYIGYVDNASLEKV